MKQQQHASLSSTSKRKAPMKITFFTLFLIPGLLSIAFLCASIRLFASQVDSTESKVIDTQMLPNGASKGYLVPSCEASPWKESENLVGSCPGGMKAFLDAATMEDCAKACCDIESCITWQFRRDKGCLHGGDVRLGMEKDGVRSWCSAEPPQKWQGQFVIRRAHGKIVATKNETGGCSITSWNPQEQQGQCFGLGDVKKVRKKDPTIAIENAQECMEACCDDEDCGAWQWQDTLGCFYHKRMHGCVDASDPIVFEPFVGRRKKQDSRTYTDRNKKVWIQQQT